MDTKSGFFFLFGDEYCVQDGNLVPRFSQGEARCKFRALYEAGSVANIPRGVLGTKMNPETFRIRLDRQIRFEYDTCGRGHF